MTQIKTYAVMFMTMPHDYATSG